MKKLVSVVLALALLATGALYAVSKGSDADTVPATDAALAWLTVVDRGDYARSWSESAELFRAAVPEAQWVQQVGAARGPLGAMQAREFVSATYATSLPGAPDGEYVVIQFRTKFVNKASAIETVTPMKDADGMWRVSGYYVR